MPYKCKACGKPVEQAIEGELICSGCYSQRQMTQEEYERELEIRYFATHCSECGRKIPASRSFGVCKRCEEEFKAEWMEDEEDYT